MQTMTKPVTPIQILNRYKTNWNLFSDEVLKVILDPEQQECLEGIQNNQRISIRSGNARGKDYVAAVASLCFLYLYYPSKVIETAPTGRQAIAIMMSEIKSIYYSSNPDTPLGGIVQKEQIVFPDNPDHYLMAFKAGETEQEPWSGFHSPNLMVVITEASGIDDTVFDAVESILTGNSKLLLCYNPYRLSGEAYRSITSPIYKKFRMNCLDAPNVKEKKLIFPGQVDYGWVYNLIHEKGWCSEITKDEVKKEECDFEFEEKWYRPNDLFRVKVLGEPPKESEDVLIPLAWIEAANERWKELKEIEGNLKLGADIAGEGRDFTVFVYRYNNIVQKIEKFSRQDHMETVGKIKDRLKGKKNAIANIDTIGEGAGVHSRCKEQGLRTQSAKFSENTKGHKDYSGEQTFANMRAYCYWAIRDALNPEYGYELALPIDDELTQELHETRWKRRSNGDIIIEPKEDIKKRLGRSPDKADGLALTFFPERRGPRARLI